MKVFWQAKARKLGFANIPREKRGYVVYKCGQFPYFSTPQVYVGRCLCAQNEEFHSKTRWWLLCKRGIYCDKIISSFKLNINFAHHWTKVRKGHDIFYGTGNVQYFVNQPFKNPCTYSLIFKQVQLSGRFFPSCQGRFVLLCVPLFRSQPFHSLLLAHWLCNHTQQSLQQKESRTLNMSSVFIFLTSGRWMSLF